MKLKDAKKVMKNLSNVIDAYNNEYYNNNESSIDDKEYDTLLDTLEKMEKIYPSDSDSPTKKVGASIKNSPFKKVDHNVKMLSLMNTYSKDDLLKYDSGIKDILKVDEIEYVLEVKLDGLSISLIYDKGKLVRGLTRGDGTTGEDVTENIKMINNIPKTISSKKYIEVRGEIILPRRKLEEINKIQESRGKKLYANCRNLASGTMRQLDPSIVKERGLECYIYQLVNYKDFNVSTHFEAIDMLENLGFPTTGIFEVYPNIKKTFRGITFWEKEKDNLRYDTDGMVIKVNKLEYYDKLPASSRYPKYAMAYKFDPEKASTRLIKITNQIGRSGIITPVAELEPVRLSSTIVSRATLHNYAYIKEKDIREGDMVIIKKAAEIIPQIESVDKKYRPDSSKEYEVPTKCPYCDSYLVSFGNVGLKCSNTFCSEKILQSLVYFCGKDAMDIKGVSNSFISLLIHMKMIHGIADLYTLKDMKETLYELKGYGENSIDKVLSAIEDSKSKPLYRIITGLGIQGVGSSMAKVLANTYHSMDKLIKATMEDLLKINGLGELIATNIIEYFSNESNIANIELLELRGLKMVDDTPADEGILKGVKFAITGKFNSIKRKDIEEYIIKNGGTLQGGIRKDTDYLIYGLNTGSKLEKAINMKVVTLSEEEFINKYL